MFVCSKLFIGGLSGKTTAGECAVCYLLIMLIIIMSVELWCFYCCMAKYTHAVENLMIFGHLSHRRFTLESTESKFGVSG